MKNGGLLWENAIPEDSVLDDASSTISKLTVMTPIEDAPSSYASPYGGGDILESPSFGGTEFESVSQEEVEAIMTPLPPEKRTSASPRPTSPRKNFSVSPQKKLEKKNLHGIGDKKYTRSRSKLNSNSSRGI